MDFNTCAPRITIHAINVGRVETEGIKLLIINNYFIKQKDPLTHFYDRITSSELTPVGISNLPAQLH